MRRLKPKDCPFCHCKAAVIKTEFAFGVQCAEKPLIHTMTRPIGEFESEAQAVTAWNFWVGTVAAQIV